MKFLLKVLVLLAVIALISAVQVDRKHHKKHHLKQRTGAPVAVMLVDAGSSKTEVSCWTYDADTKALLGPGEK